MASDSTKQKIVLFFPLNSPGHINSSLGIADRIKATHKHRTVFLLLGSMIGNSIREHGHELVLLEEVSPLEDYEILDGDDPTKPVDEELMRQLGRVKKKFPGVYKWPQVILRQQHLLQLDPVDAVVQSCEVMEKLMVGELMDNEKNYAAAIELIKPDLIIIDAYYMPPCLIKQTRIPWVRLYSANPLQLLESNLPGGIKPPVMVGTKLYDKQERERLRIEDPARWQLILDEWQDKTNRINAAMDKASSFLLSFLSEQDCTLPPGKQAPDSPHFNIYMFPKALDYDEDVDIFRYPQRWFRCDSMMRKQATPSDSDELREWAQKLGSQLINKEAVVYFSLGSLASGLSDLMRRYVDMLAADKKRLYVVSKGVQGDRYELCPDNMIGGNYIPQNYFLQRADLAIIRGGNNSVTECLFHGLPMIVLPVFADQLDNAQRVEDMGLGKRLDVFDCSQEKLLRTIDETLKDQAIVQRTRSIGEAMQKRDDLAKVVTMLDKLMTDGKLDNDYIEQMGRDDDQ